MGKNWLPMQQCALFCWLAAAAWSVNSASATARRIPGSAFRDCVNCPMMVVVPAGRFAMGSSAAEQSWAVSHGATAGSVSDESPQHEVTLRSFALGKYDVTRAEYAAFVRDTGYPQGDGCGHDGEKRNKQPRIARV